MSDVIGTRITLTDYREAERIAIGMTRRRYNHRRLPVAIDICDLEQATRIGVYRAALSYDPIYGIPFSTYAGGAGYHHAKRCYEKAFRVGVHRARAGFFEAFQQEESTDALQGKEDPDERLIDLIPAPIDYEDEDDLPGLRSFFAVLLKSLSDREQSAVSLHVYQSLTFREIGVIWGVSASKGWQVYTRAIKKLKEALVFPHPYAAITIVRLAASGTPLSLPSNEFKAAPRTAVGSCKKVGDCRWRLGYDVYDPLRRRVTLTFQGSEADARAELARLIKQAARP